MKLNIVILDAHTTNPGDLSWDALSALGNLAVYDRTPAELIVERAKDASILVTNKAVISSTVLEKLPRLQCICVLATGYNNIDIEAASRKNVTVCNVRGYAADSAAQHVFALLLELTNAAGQHSNHVKAGGWAKSPDWSYTLSPTMELAGKTMGIYGFGQIGQKVAGIAQGFGMKVISHHKHPRRDAKPGVRFVSFENMLTDSDAISLNAPLTNENQRIINRRHLSLMKPSAFLINTGRGGLVNEPDLKWALENGVIAGAGLDVLSEEPPRSGNILQGVKNCLITPHMAWATKEARSKLIRETVENVKAFLSGKPRYAVVSKQ